MWLVRGTQAPGALSLRVLDRVPGPAVAVDESPGLVGSVGNVDPEVGDLGIRLLEVCVGDRLALARASPRRPDVDEHRPSAEVGEGDPLAVDRPPFDRGRGRTVGSRRRAGRRRLCRHLPGRGGFLLARASSAPSGKQRRCKCERHESRESSHRSTVATPAGGPGRFRFPKDFRDRPTPPISVVCIESPPSLQQPRFRSEPVLPTRARRQPRTGRHRRSPQSSMRV